MNHSSSTTAHHCPLCSRAENALIYQFPATDQGLIALVQANLPGWEPGFGACPRCLALFRNAKQRLEADGIEVIGPTDHTIFKSIYFFDPSGHRLELVVNTGTPEMMQKLDDVKWDMINEWAITRKAPKHAAWMHDRSHSVKE